MWLSIAVIREIHIIGFFFVYFHYTQIGFSVSILKIESLRFILISVEEMLKKHSRKRSSSNIDVVKKMYNNYIADITPHLHRCKSNQCPGM